jgi:sigma-70-like protein
MQGDNSPTPQSARLADSGLLPFVRAGFFAHVDLEAAAAALAPRLLAYALARTGCRATAEDVAQDALTALVRRWREIRVTIDCRAAPVPDVIAAIGAAIGVAVTIEPGLPSDPVGFAFKDAPTAEVLNILCNLLQCAWDFDPERGLRVTQKR